MTEEQIKEQLGSGFVRLISSRLGFKCGKPEPDNGVDLEITRSKVTFRNGHRRILDTGEYIHLQLKTTCHSSVIIQEDCLKYDLEVKNYHDLIDRKKSNSITPLYLLLLVLPNDSNDWLNISPESLLLKGSAYWYVPDDTANYTDNTSRIRVEIPIENFVTINFLSERFEEVYG